MLRINNEVGKPFNVKIVKQGEKYGLNDCLVHDKADPMIEFYDAEFSPSQFVSRYYLSTLEEFDGRYGLSLDGGIPEWSVSSDNVREAVSYARNVVHGVLR